MRIVYAAVMPAFGLRRDRRCPQAVAFWREPAAIPMSLVNAGRSAMQCSAPCACFAAAVAEWRKRAAGTGCSTRRSGDVAETHRPDVDGPSIASGCPRQQARADRLSHRRGGATGLLGQIRGEEQQAWICASAGPDGLPGHAANFALRGTRNRSGPGRSTVITLVPVARPQAFRPRRMRGGDPVPDRSKRRSPAAPIVPRRRMRRRRAVAVAPCNGRLLTSPAGTQRLIGRPAPRAHLPAARDRPAPALGHRDPAWSGSPFQSHIIPPAPSTTGTSAAKSWSFRPASQTMSIWPLATRP